MEKSAYERLIGKPQKLSANHIKNVFQYVHTLSRKDGYPQSDPDDLRHWDVVITLSASFTRGHLTSFRVDRVETN
jgi:hypothetical protein